MVLRAALLALVSLAGCALLVGCAAEPDWNAAAQQALADGRASLAVLGAPTPAATRPSPREPSRIRPLRASSLPAAPLIATPAFAPPDSTASLAGSGPDRLVALLGEPMLRRAEGPVSIWLYSAAGCQLDVMFYPSAEGPRVGFVQARAGGFAQRTEAACLRDLAAGARHRPPEPRQGRLGAAETVG